MGGGIKLRKIWSMPYLQIIIFLLRAAFGSFFPQNLSLKRHIHNPASSGRPVRRWCLGEALHKSPGSEQGDSSSCHR